MEMDKAQLHAQKIAFAPDWAQDTSIHYPKELSALLDADDSLQIYGVFDGTRRAAVRGLNDLDTLALEIDATPLFNPDTAEGEAGPWLLSFGRGQGAQAAVLRDHFCKFHGQGVGILLLTTASTSEIRSHLRGLVKVARDPETTSMVFFRYWDPVVANEFLPSLATQSDRLERFLFTQNGSPVHFLSEQSPDEMNAFHLSGRATRTGVRKYFSLATCDAPVMDRIARIGLEHNLSRWLARDYADDLFSGASVSALGPHILREGARYGFTRQDEYSYLGHLMVHLGGWFHQSGQTPTLTAILESDVKAKQVPLRAAFSDAWAGSYRAVARNWSEHLIADPRLITTIDDCGTLTPDRRLLADCLEAHIPVDRQGPFRQLWKKTQGPLAALGAPEAHWARLAFLSLFWGYKFYEDPFLGRSHPPQSAADWNTLCNDFWKALIDG